MPEPAKSQERSAYIGATKNAFVGVACFGIAVVVVGICYRIFTATDIIGIITLVVALMTLLAVIIQIGLAREELNAVQEDLNNNRQALELAQQQAKDASRSPKLELMWSNHTNSTIVNRPGGKAIIIHEDFFVRNTGDRTSRDCSFEILVPLEGWDAPFMDPKIVEMFGGQHVLKGGRVDNPTYNNQPNIAGGIDIRLNPRLESGHILRLRYRIFDDFATYPISADGSAAYGDLFLRIEDS